MPNTITTALHPMVTWTHGPLGGALTALPPAQWSSGRVSVMRPGGCGFNPWLGHTKDCKTVKMEPMVPPCLALSIRGLDHPMIPLLPTEDKFHLFERFAHLGWENAEGFPQCWWRWAVLALPGAGDRVVGLRKLPPGPKTGEGTIVSYTFFQVAFGNK